MKPLPSESEGNATVPVGLLVVGKDAQRFRCSRIVEKQARNGNMMTLAVWETRCRTCQVSMEVFGWARLVQPENFRKQCDECHPDTLKGFWS